MSVVCTVRIDNDKHDALIKIAKANKRNKAFYIREAIDDYLFDQKEADIALERMNDPDEKLYTTQEMALRLEERKKRV